MTWPPHDKPRATARGDDGSQKTDRFRNAIPRQRINPASAKRQPLVAVLIAKRTPPEPGRRHCYLYSVILGGEVIVANSPDPETDAARVLVALGITGKLTIIDGKTFKSRMIVNIAKAAKVTVCEDRQRGPRLRTYRESGAGSASAAETATAGIRIGRAA